MKNKSLFKFLLASTTALSFFGLVEPISAQKANYSYSCDLDGGQLATVANTPSGKVRLIDWESQKSISGEQNLIELCQKVSQTMQSHAAAGLLNYVSTGSLNNQRFVCVSDKAGKCLQNARGDVSFLFALQPDRNPEDVLKSIFNASAISGDRQTNKLVVDLNRILGKKDGSVATQTTPPASQNSKTQTTTNREAQNNSNRVSYKCIDREGKYLTVAYTKNGPVRLIQWKSEFFASSGYTPQTRCTQVSERFQRHYDANALKFITTGKINNQPVICVADKVGNDYACKTNGLLLTLEPRDNPTEILRSLFDLAARTSSGPLTRGGQQQVVIDMEAFLTQAKPME